MNLDEVLKKVVTKKGPIIRLPLNTQKVVGRYVESPAFDYGNRRLEG